MRRLVILWFVIGCTRSLPAPAGVDPRIDPCSDFYAYACGPWLNEHPIAADASSSSAFRELERRNDARVQALLDRVAASPADATERRVGDYWAACMDVRSIDARGLDTLRRELANLDGLTRSDELPGIVAWLQAIGVSVPFSLEVVRSRHGTEAAVLEIDRGSLGLPSADDYRRDDLASLRVDYRDHLRRVFVLIGHAPAAAVREADEVLRLETRLAQAALDANARRDPGALDHPMGIAELEALTPAFDWRRFVSALGAIGEVPINLTEPAWLRTFGDLVRDEPVSVWKAYFTWHLVRETTPLLPQAFGATASAFYQVRIGGARTSLSRSATCLELLNRDLGETLGRLYVRAWFPPATGARIQAMVKLLRAALRETLARSWLSPATKTAALAKADALTVKIGHPDRWRKETAVIARDDAWGNALRARRANTRSLIDALSRPYDRGQWFELPQTVSAYGTQSLNEIAFAAGILQAPAFDPAQGDAENFGAIGGVIGHEVSHRFDDRGRHFNARGDLIDWWTPADAAEYQRRAQCFVDQYSRYPAIGELFVDGKLTLGENLADNVGLRLAWIAAGLERASATEAQRFFVSWARIRCEALTAETARRRALGDPHSPGRWRTNGVLANMPEFRRAFACSESAPMVREPVCRMW